MHENQESKIDIKMPDQIAQISPRWLVLQDAVRYSPFGEKTLIRLAKCGVIKGNKVPFDKAEKWVFDRLSIDAYLESCMSCKTVDQKAVDILETLGK